MLNPHSPHLQLLRQESWRQQIREVVVAHRDRQRAQLARGEVTCVAVAYQHRLGVWRPDPDHSSHRLIACVDCGAGASVDVGTGEASISDALRGSCRRRP